MLAPGRAISIQAHPTAEQARVQREATADEVYVDDWAKPELLLAIAPFEVFVGMRSHAQVVDLVERLDVPRLRDPARADRRRARTPSSPCSPPSSRPRPPRSPS